MGRKKIADVEKRREKLQEILNDNFANGSILTSKMIMDKMKDAKFPYSNRRDLYRDRVALAKNNSFVRDMAESTYSANMEESFEVFTHIRDEALRLAGSEWEKRKHKTKNADTGVSTENETITDEAGPKNMFLNLAMNAEKCRVDMMNGDLLNYSVAFLGKKLNQYKTQLAELEAKKKTKMNVNGEP